MMEIRNSGRDRENATKDGGSNPTVAVVILNINQADMLIDCVSSLLDGARKPDEIIVVDNGSSDGSAKRVREIFGDALELVELSENRGFAGGNNAGAARAKSDWLALINNDAIADSGWLESMLETARQDPRLGLVACVILREDSRDLLDNLGLGLWPDGMSRGVNHLDRASAAPKQAVFIPSGCAMMIKRELFEAVGGFDEELFFYSEDTDLGIKVRRLGYKCALSEKAAVYHKGGKTLGTVSPAKLYYVERNRIAVLIRHFPAWAILLSPFFTLFRYAGLGWGVLMSSRRRAVKTAENSAVQGGMFSLVRALLRAYLDAMIRIPRDLRQRREWRLKAKTPAGAMNYWLWRYRLDRHSLFGLEKD